MSLPNPGMSFTPFDPLPASDMNDLVENIEALAAGTGLNDDAVTAPKIVGIDKSNLTTDSNPYKFHVYKNTAQSMTGNTFSVVQYNVEDFDTNNNYDNATNFRYTAPVNGFYWFKGQVCDDTGATTIFIPSIYKNGTEYARGNDIRLSMTNRVVTESDFIQLTAGDTVDFRLFPDATTNLDVSARHLNSFTGYLVCRT